MNILKTIIVFFACIFYIFGLSVNKYDFQVDYIEFPESRRDQLFDYGTLRSRKYNRTMNTLNGYFDVLSEFNNTLTFHIKVSVLSGNQYRQIFERDVPRMCSDIENDKLYMPKILPYTSFGKFKCPLKVGYRAHFYDLPIEPQQLHFSPLSAEKYRAEISFFQSNKIVLANYTAYIIISKVNSMGKLG